MEQNFQNSSLEEKAALIKSLSSDILAEGRTDLLLKAIGVPILEQLRIEAARATLSRITGWAGSERYSTAFCHLCSLVYGERWR